MIYKCEKCGCHEVEEVTRGSRIAKVVGVTLDNGLVCDLTGFVADENNYATYYRCKKCLEVLGLTTKEFVEFLRKD